jgi:hypothetical protein
LNRAVCISNFIVMYTLLTNLNSSENVGDSQMRESRGYVEAPVDLREFG